MPIPTYEGRRTYFFFADVEPKELMTFGVEAGIQLDDDSTLDVLGHALAYWSIAEEQDVLTLRAFVQDVFDVTLAIYALIRLDRGDRRDALRLRAELHSWLEVRGVEARANVVGTIHERCEAGAVTELDGPRAGDFTTAATAAWRFVREPTLRLAFKDLGFSLRDRGDDAFLYAYRAVENARRFHADKVSATETKPVWPPLHSALDERGATPTAHGRRDVDSPRRYEERRSRRRSRESRRDPRTRGRRSPATRSARGRELVAGAHPRRRVTG